MGSEWRKTTLGEVIELKRGYDLPTKFRRPGPFPVVSSSGPTDTHAESKAKAPGVVTGRYGTIGEVYYITTDYWPLNTALYVKDFKGNNPRFVSYFLRGIDFVAYSDKSAVPGVNRNHLHQARVSVPPLPVQKRIADVLGKLDDKIELNRRMNRTLEKMAAAIFKSWFIDFDPVHAKADLPAGRQEAALPSAAAGKWFVYALECEGGSVYIGHTEDLPRRFDQHMSGKGAEWTKTHPPIRVAHWEAFDTRKEAVLREKKLKTGSGREWLKAEIEKNRLVAQCGLPAELADLFPDTFEDSDLGQIPEGWKLKPIGEAVRCVGGATPSTKNLEFWEGGRHPFVTPKDMSSLQSPVILDSERHITDAGVEKISSKQLPVGTVILSSRAPIGYLGVATVPVSVNQGVIAMICDGDLPNLYVLHWTAANMDLIKSRAGGTTFAEISKRNFRPIPALVPNKPVLEAFMANVAPLHERIGLAVRQNRCLVDLRDTLLPKLLSGEIELPEAEAIAEEVG